MEGSVTLWMPDQWKLEKVRHPYQRTYRDDKRARWETDDSYCDTYAMFEICLFPTIWRSDAYRHLVSNPP